MTDKGFSEAAIQSVAEQQVLADLYETEVRPQEVAVRAAAADLVMRFGGPMRITVGEHTHELYRRRVFSTGYLMVGDPEATPTDFVVPVVRVSSYGPHEKAVVSLLKTAESGWTQDRREAARTKAATLLGTGHAFEVELGVAGTDPDLMKFPKPKVEAGVQREIRPLAQTVVQREIRYPRTRHEAKRLDDDERKSRDHIEHLVATDPDVACWIYQPPILPNLNNVYILDILRPPVYPDGLNLDERLELQRTHLEWLQEIGNKFLRVTTPLRDIEAFRPAHDLPRFYSRHDTSQYAGIPF